MSYTEESSMEPPVWWEARVLSIRGEFCKCRFLCGHFADEAIEQEAIRPAQPVCSSSSKPCYTKTVVSLPNDKSHAWFLQNEPRVASDVRHKAGLLSVVVDKTKPVVSLIGSAKAMTNAKMLLELHMKHLVDMARLHAEREALTTRLEEEKERRDTCVRIEFPIDKELIGLVIGKSGKTLADAKKQAGVDVIDIDTRGPRVVVIGPTKESCDAARELLEFVSESVPVEPEQVGWLIGRSGRNFKELQERTRVARLSVDKVTNAITMVGTTSAVEAARLYIDTHLHYLAEFDAEVAESDKLRRELRGIAISSAGGAYRNGPSGTSLAFGAARNGSNKGAKSGGSGRNVMLKNGGRGGSRVAQSAGDGGGGRPTAAHKQAKSTGRSGVTAAESAGRPSTRQVPGGGSRGRDKPAASLVASTAPAGVQL